MHRVLAIVATVTLLLAGVLATTHAAERAGKGKADAAKAGKPMGPLAALDLTPEQQQKVDQIHQAAMKQAEPLHQELAAKMKEMQALWAVDKPDKVAIEKKHAEMSALNAKLWSIHIDAKLQIHGILTPAQRSKWAEQASMGPGMGMHGMAGPGMGMMGMPGGGCPGMHGGNCSGKAGGDCPCMHGGGADHGPGCPHAGAAGKAGMPDKK
jgi:Spy/CpxP family protein refolding chaperone